MSKFFDFVGGMVIGAVVGAGAGLLLAPQSGGEFKRTVRELIDLTIE